MKRMIFPLSISIVFFLVISSFKLNIETEFSPEEMKEINEEVEDRVAAFSAKERNKCQERLLDEAESMVDTILMFNSKELLGTDTVSGSVPEKPQRPDKPEILKPTDDSPLQPLIKDDEELF